MMRMIQWWVFRLSLFVLMASGPLAAQTASVQQAWDIGKTLKGVSANITRIMPILEQIRPQEWVSRGAPDTYATQWKSSIAQANAISSVAQSLQLHPEKLPDALQLLFRIQAFHAELASVGEGLRKYQNPALADLMFSVASEDLAVREQLQQYVLDMATEKEQQFQVADREAQRCRASLSRETPSTTRRAPARK